MHAHGHNQLRTHHSVAFHTTRFSDFFFEGRILLGRAFRIYAGEQTKGEGQHDEVPVPHNACDLARLEGSVRSQLT